MSDVQTLPGLALAGLKTLLVKFYFTNETHVPKGIPKKERANDAHMDARHAAGAGDQDAAEVGRHREGRIDTGVPVVQGLPCVQVALLRQGLALRGFRLKDLHWYYQPERRRSRAKFVVVCVYEPGAQIVPLKGYQTEALRNLASMARWTAYVWNNPGGVATINLTGREPYHKATNALVIRGGAIVAIPVTQDVAEGDE